MRAPHGSYDKLFAGISAALIVAGLFILTSASLGLSIAKFQTPYYYLFHQLLMGVIPGLLLFWGTYHIDYHYWKKLALPLLFLSFVLLALIYVPNLGMTHGGARRWLKLGSFTFQPSELLKFAYVAYLAAWFEGRAKDLGTFTRGLLPFLVMNAFICAIIIAQPDLGTLLVLLAAAAGLFFISGAPMKHLATAVCVALIFLGILAYTEPYRFDRVKVFFDSSHDLQGSGYQVRQALIAIGSGGVWGKGFALSDQKYSYLPEPMGDSIFAIVGEEVGFLGSSAIVVLFLLFYLRGSAIMKKAPDTFGYLLGMGILFLITAQAMINMGAIAGLIPLTGIPLSFISYGGSSLFVILAELGVIFNISRYT